MNKSHRQDSSPALEPKYYAVEIVPERQFFNGREYLVLIDHDRRQVRIWEGIPPRLRPLLILDASAALRRSRLVVGGEIAPAHLDGLECPHRTNGPADTPLVEHLN